jgi:hypothetical protein
MTTSAIENACIDLLATLGAVAGVSKAYTNAPEMSGVFPFLFVVPIATRTTGGPASITTFATLKAELHIARGVLPEADKKARPLFALFESAIFADPTLGGTVDEVREARQSYVYFEVGAEKHVGIRVEVDVKIRRTP